MGLHDSPPISGMNHMVDGQFRGYEFWLPSANATLDWTVVLFRDFLWVQHRAQWLWREGIDAHQEQARNILDQVSGALGLAYELHPSQVVCRMGGVPLTARPTGANCTFSRFSRTGTVCLASKVATEMQASEGNKPMSNCCI
jgi:hypothetical protein